jgi:dTDP-4-dehydrorhamnose 3,5-epimerase
VEIERSSILGFNRFHSELLKDNRGSFMEWINPLTFAELSSPFVMVQSNIVTSKMGVIRGLHFSIEPQTKIITCIVGEIRDVVLDIRPNSKTFGQVAVFSLDEIERQTVTIEPGLAHGYEVVSDFALVVYATNTRYNPLDDHSINPLQEMEPNTWLNNSPNLSTRDLNSPSFTSVVNSGILNLLDC